ncbi:hypothetical protein Zmor_027106 [Zophobas morio]|jgi:hypothetical protein|uniref:Uncharacterized protein n=1 Tax=Zophobas morio TaxID=2755281 RepID=A0AA38HJ09_9CUCU|nr:hypothetical protein Zmor_027106 [Zophobas morio]
MQHDSYTETIRITLNTGPEAMNDAVLVEHNLPKGLERLSPNQIYGFRYRNIMLYKPQGRKGFVYNNKFKRESEERTIEGVLLSKPSDSTDDESLILNTDTNSIINLRSLTFFENIIPFCKRRINVKPRTTLLIIQRTLLHEPNFILLERESTNTERTDIVGDPLYFKPHETVLGDNLNRNKDKEQHSNIS